MLYPKNNTPELDAALFQNPTSEYRAAPFWAWNCELTLDMLSQQIECFKRMGMGGFHMHSRSGLSIPYLGEDYMDLVKGCVEKARKENMLAWLYDEDRWPSGTSGGKVTQNPDFIGRYLLFTPFPYGSDPQTPGLSQSRSENGHLLARYDIGLHDDGSLSSYRMLKEEENGANIWYAYMEYFQPEAWFNNQAYVNTLDKKAIQAFVATSHESYRKAVGKDFGGVIPAIFTDEPQAPSKGILRFAHQKMDLRMPWTDDLPKEFSDLWGQSLLEDLPQLIWELPGGEVSVFRYRYHDLVAERFVRCYADTCGEWCQRNGIMLTGHVMDEPTLERQTGALGEAMRSYRSFELPGIDMLCDYREFNTAKQAQSAARQYGRPGVMSELYGVTNWDFDFRGYKLQGDWQAAMGVTVRVPHLAWVSMGGNAKRDYPPSLSHQAPWHEEYPMIEDHFARVNTAMTRGRSMVKVGVIHLSESYWLHWGPQEQTAGIRKQMEDSFENITQWLLFGQIDFDFICESLLPELCPKGDAPLQVGEMAYDVIIIPGSHTLRSSTVERLEAFVQAGGSLLLLGDDPRLIDALPAEDKLLPLLDCARRIPSTKDALLAALEPHRMVDIRNDHGIRSHQYITQIRQDGADRWLFIANGTVPQSHDIIPANDLMGLFNPTQQQAYVRIKGHFNPQIYDTLTGEISPLPARIEGQWTCFVRNMYAHDSLLLKLSPGTPSLIEEGLPIPSLTLAEAPEGRMGKVPVRLNEPNVLVLDMAEYALDNSPFQPSEEILRIDTLLRNQLHYPSTGAQPYAIPYKAPDHVLHLRFTLHSEIEVPQPTLALEQAASCKVALNGMEVPSHITGFYVDEAIQTIALPPLPAGTSTLTVAVPFGWRTFTENCYLLGDFGVRVAGESATIIPPVRELAFGDVCHQGLPFYGGNITYLLSVQGSGEDVTLHAPQYRGALIGVELDGKRIGSIAFAPYNLILPQLSTGTHQVALTLYGSRINTFGQLHNSDENWFWFGSMAWETRGDMWSYEYRLKPVGILKSPGLR